MSYRLDFNIFKTNRSTSRQYQIFYLHLRAVPRWDDQAGARFRTAVLKSGGLSAKHLFQIPGGICNII